MGWEFVNREQRPRRKKPAKPASLKNA